MPKKRGKPEQGGTLLRQIEVAVAHGKTTPQPCKEAGGPEQTATRWRKEYGGGRGGRGRVQCIWGREGLKVPARQTPRGRLWRHDGSCVRLRPERAHHVWSYDFVRATTHDGRTLRLLTLIDEYTRECLAIRVARRLGSHEVLETLADVMLWRGIPEHIRSDNGPEFIAKELRTWLAVLGARPLYTTPGSPWENGYCESFNGKLRDEGLNGELFYSLKEAQIVVKQWRREWNSPAPPTLPPPPAARPPRPAPHR